MGWRDLASEIGGDPARMVRPDVGGAHALELARGFVRAVRAEGWTPYASTPVATLAQPVFAAPAAVRADALVIAALAASSVPAAEPERVALLVLAAELAATPLDLPDDALLALLDSLLPDDVALEAVAARRAIPLAPTLRAAVEARIPRIEGRIAWETRAEARAARLLAARLASADGCPLAPCPWGDAVAAWVRRQSAAPDWIALLWHAAGATGKTKPTRAWSKDGAARVKRVGVEQVRSAVTAWCATEPRPETHGSQATGSLRPANGEVLRGLLLLVAPEGDERFVTAVEALAARCWEKVDTGPRAANLGVAAIQALRASPGSAPALGRLRDAISYDRARRELDRA